MLLEEARSRLVGLMSSVVAERDDCDLTSTLYSVALRKQPRRDSVFVYSVLYKHHTSSQRVTVITLLPPFVNNTCCGMRRREDKHDRELADRVVGRVLSES